MSEETKLPNNPDSPIKISGKIPPAMMQALNRVKAQKQEPVDNPVSQARAMGSGQLEDLIAGLNQRTYDEISLPSLGIFYDGKDGPTDGMLHLRAMTGEEEQILATPRYVRRGQAVDMIFKRCLQESFNTNDFLSIDRTFILIYLRGISYTSDYEVEVKCPECDRKFPTTLKLDKLKTEYCPKNYHPPLTGVLPKSGYKFEYRLSRGKDEQNVQDYRERHLKMFGDVGTDDTLLYRTAMLLSNIEGLKDKNELIALLKKLPIQDLGHIRNLINEPPFGVNTKCEVDCAVCYRDFEIELPLEANFFFPRPRKKREETE